LAVNCKGKINWAESDGGERLKKIPGHKVINKKYIKKEARSRILNKLIFIALRKLKVEERR
jgi:hypothetical protein